MKSCCKDTFQNQKMTTQPDQNKKSYLNKLQTKWQVKNILQVVLILCTFAIGGSLCAFLGRKVMPLFTIENKAVWTIVYILIVTILWPLCVLAISIPFGQFSFFVKYLSKMGRRMVGKK